MHPTITYSGHLVCYNTYTATYYSSYVLTLAIPTTYTHEKIIKQPTIGHNIVTMQVWFRRTKEKLTMKYLTVIRLNDSIMQLTYLSVHA